MAATVLPLAGGIDMAPFAAAAEMGGGGGVLHPRLDPADAVALTLIVWVLGVAATLWPARAAARTNPAVSMAAM